MARFLDPLRVEQVRWETGRSVWMTLAPLRYESDRLKTTIIVPAEMITDFGSVPRLPVVWLIAGGRGNRSAVIHDAAYQFGFWWILLPSGEWWAQPVERAVADEVFYESLLADPISGVGPIRAREMWLAVRVGGRGVWANQGRASDLNPIWSGGGWETP